MALFSNAKAIKQAKEAAGQQQGAAIYGMEAASAQSARQLAGQQAQSNIFNALGQPGTFGPTAGTFQYGDGSTNMFDPNAQKDQSLKQFASYGGGKQLKTPRQGIIDPEAYANQVIGTIPFQIRSQQTAEAQQLLNKQGPAWDVLENATIGTIHEGAALQLRDTMRQLKNNYAKGGTARRTAVNEFSTIVAQENAMRARTQETWQANLRLFDYVRQNADRVEAGNRSFVENINGLSSAHMAAMQATAALQVEAGAIAGKLAGQAYEIRRDQQARNFGTKLLEGVIMSAASSVLKGAGESGTFASAGAWLGEKSGNATAGGALGLFGGLLDTTASSMGKSLGDTGITNYTPEQQAAVDRYNQLDANARAQAHLGVQSKTTGGVDSWWSGNTGLVPEGYGSVGRNLPPIPTR